MVKRGGAIFSLSKGAILALFVALLVSSGSFGKIPKISQNQKECLIIYSRMQNIASGYKADHHFSRRHHLGRRGFRLRSKIGKNFKELAKENELSNQQLETRARAAETRVFMANISDLYDLLANAPLNKRSAYNNYFERISDIRKEWTKRNLDGGGYVKRFSGPSIISAVRIAELADKMEISESKLYERAQRAWRKLDFSLHSELIGFLNETHEMSASEFNDYVRDLTDVSSWNFLSASRRSYHPSLEQAQWLLGYAERNEITLKELEKKMEKIAKQKKMDRYREIIEFLGDKE